MTEPFVLVQLSDPHIGGTWAAGDPTAGWRAAIEAVGRLLQRPAAVLVSGDLADHASDAEYAVVTSGLAALDAPAYVLPGNHDDRTRLREHFELPGEPLELVRYAIDFGALRLVVIDTTKPGCDDGEVGPEQLDWLEAELSAAPHQVTLLAMHHPPFVTGLPACDAVGLAASDRVELEKIVSRHPQVRRILSGHTHRAITAELAGRTAISSPSTYAQGRLRLDTNELEVFDEPAGFAVHAVYETEVVSHIQPVTAEVPPASN